MHRVVPGVQVAHGSTIYGPGDTVGDVPADVLARWLRMGWVETIRPRRSGARRDTA